MPRSNEWTRNGSFFNKPTRGWIHPGKQLADSGITYSVRYVGRLQVNASMKSLEFESRSQVAKECINRICEVAGLKGVDRKRRVDKKIAKMLGDKPDMEYAGSNVNLHVSSSHLKLIVMETQEIIANHDMPNVSFASGGDPETLDFVSYVAKNANNDRACYVLECGGGLAQDVITTIGQAFELRFKEYLQKNALRELPQEGCSDDPEYYNDLPGKLPPEAPSATIPIIPPWPDYQNDCRWTDNSRSKNYRKASTDNLIDLSSEPSSPLTKVPAGPEYVNECVALGGAAGLTDPFDMQPFGENLPDSCEKRQLSQEVWFHGPISRRTAESLLIHDGDFLVRESRGSPGQFVLSGMHKQLKKHLLLVDPEGVVRTKDRKFDSVSHLVDYHRNNRLPIISAESAMILDNPVSRTSLQW
uniref:SHC-transforming protein 1 n=1 Tax=Strigamia maritima TaxID=126957 RepID=T1J823_STRMM